MKFKITYFILFFLLFSCKNEIEKEKIVKEDELINEDKNKESIEVLFDETKFDDKSELEILKELGKGICNPLEKDEENYISPACSPKFFKIMPFKEDAPLKDAFILLIKSKVHGFPLRRVYVFQRENGKLIKVNSFVANIIEKRKSTSKHDDLILRFSDEDQNHFNCLFSWKTNHYEYQKVEQINDANIKVTYQDSMNVEILKVLESNKMLNI